MNVFSEVIKTIWEIIKKIPKWFWCILVVIIILITIIITINKSQENKTSFENTSVLKNIPTERIKVYETFLRKNIEYDVGNVSDEIIKDVIIRDGTYKETPGGEGERGYIDSSFIVDVDSINRTYDILLRWTTDGSKYEMQDVGVRVNCVAPSESKYPEAKCKTFTSSYKDFEGGAVKTNNGDSGKDENAKR